MPIFNPTGQFAITIYDEAGVASEKQACKEFKLFERPNSTPEERYHLEWFDLTKNQREAFIVCTYNQSLDGRKYTMVNDIQYTFIFESKMLIT